MDNVLIITKYYQKQTDEQIKPVGIMENLKQKQKTLEDEILQLKLRQLD